MLYLYVDFEAYNLTQIHTYAPFKNTQKQKKLTTYICRLQFDQHIVEQNMRHILTNFKHSEQPTNTKTLYIMYSIDRLLHANAK